MKTRICLAITVASLLGLAKVHSQSLFTKITEGAIATDREASFMSVWWDYDNDGWLDLFVANQDYSAGPQTHSLYHNLRDGTFDKVTNTTTTVSTDALAAVAADFDNDGDEDLFVCRHNALDDCFRNDGNGVFTRLTQAQFGRPVADGSISHDAAWVDYDRDGFLDLFVVNGFPATENDCLYRNNGSGLFIKMTAGQVGPIVSDQATTSASSWADYDNDGYPDAWVERWTGSGFLYHNGGLDAPGFFTLATEGSIPRENSRAAGQWVDYDNDAWLDLFVAGSSEGRTNSLHRNAGGLAFTDVAASAGLAQKNYAWASAWGDYDNDGWQDLFVAAFENRTNVFYRNRGDGTFETLDIGSPLLDGNQRASVSWAHYDNDGFLDLLITCGNGTRLPNHLYRNKGPGIGNANHWLKVKLVGRASNRSGIGAKIRVKATIAGTELWQMREISGNSEFGGSTGRLAHFGLGDATKADLVWIEWPSGIRQELTDVPAGQPGQPPLEIVEHCTDCTEAPRFTGATPSPAGLELTITESASFIGYMLEASTDLATWTKLMARAGTRSQYQWTDSQATNFPVRFYRLVVP